jgi:hypothetical protein
MVGGLLMSSPFFAKLCLVNQSLCPDTKATSSSKAATTPS